MSGRVSRALRAGAAALATSIIAGGGAAPAVGNGPGDQIVRAQLAFQVVNHNDTAVECPYDDQTYRLQAELVASRSALVPPSQPRSVTVYVHGAFAPASTWTAVPGYDTMEEMARKGHISIAVTRAGWTPSGIPDDGKLVCHGGHAAMLRQVVDHLRYGTYEIEPGPPGFHGPPEFDRVAVAGHSGGGAVARVLAYSHPAALDALIFVDTFRYAEANPAVVDAFLSPEEVSGIPPFNWACAVGGRPKDRDDDRLGVGGYLYVTPIQHRPDVFFNLDNTDPGVVGHYQALGQREPCGEWDSNFATAFQDQQRMGVIRAPTLYIYGTESKAWQPGAFDREHKMLGTTDVTGIGIAPSGHSMMLERSAPRFRDALSAWLAGRGF